MPSFRYELRCEGRVAGIDEAGRGPLAGPVVAAVAVIDRGAAKRKLLKLIDDSKKLAVANREEAYAARQRVEVRAPGDRHGQPPHRHRDQVTGTT